MRCLTFVASFLLILPQPSYAQGRPVQQPSTKIEAFQARPGTVIIRSFSTMGVAQGLSDGQVRVEYDALTDVTSGEKGIGSPGTAARTGRSLFLGGDRAAMTDSLSSPVLIVMELTYSFGLQFIRASARSESPFPV